MRGAGILFMLDRKFPVFAFKIFGFCFVVTKTSGPLLWLHDNHDHFSPHLKKIAILSWE
jgi:hypothetical protein